MSLEIPSYDFNAAEKQSAPESKKEHLLASVDQIIERYETLKVLLQETKDETAITVVAETMEKEMAKLDEAVKYLESKK